MTIVTSRNENEGEFNILGCQQKRNGGVESLKCRYIFWWQLYNGISFTLEFFNFWFILSIRHKKQKYRKHETRVLTISFSHCFFCNSENIYKYTSIFFLKPSLLCLHVFLSKNYVVDTTIFSGKDRAELSHIPVQCILQLTTKTQNEVNNPRKKHLAQKTKTNYTRTRRKVKKKWLQLKPSKRSGLIWTKYQVKRKTTKWAITDFWKILNLRSLVKFSGWPALNVCWNVFFS